LTNLKNEKENIMHDNITPPDYDEIEAEQDWKDEWMAEQVKNAMTELKETDFFVVNRGTKHSWQVNLDDILGEANDEQSDFINSVLSQVLFGHTINQPKLWTITEQCLERLLNANDAYDDFCADRDEG